ncbi:MAG TPA: hypothetical protein PLE30_07835 [Candidatus Kapabacteria bacterium]|nr:hypothetical protein [Candidatus Kapabacteria bacterium]
MIINSLLIPILLLFSINLQEIDIDNYDNCIFIIVNDLYCKDCLSAISKCQAIWENDFQTIVIRKSAKNKKAVYIVQEMLKGIIKYDELILTESKPREFNRPIRFLEQDFFETPTLIIRQNKKDYNFPFNYLFDLNYATHLEKKLKDSIAAIIRLK